MFLKDKIAIVTGGTRGIGRGIVETFAKHGASVAFTYVSNSSEDKAKELEKSLSDNGFKVKAYKSNASIFKDSEVLVEKVIEDFGGLDILVNNAGIARDNLLMRLSEDDFDTVIETNLKSVFNLTKSSLRNMMKQKSGSIINISSVVGIKGNAGQSNYAASKAGVIGFSKSIALELGSRNIRCNVVAPGFIETDMTSNLNPDILKTWIESIPLKRAGSTEDIANACVYLGSDLSNYVTGQVISVNGGMLT